jgi:hypothetical protein
MHAIQRQLAGVRGGEAYAVSAAVRREGCGFAGAVVRWKDASGGWTAQARDVTLAPAGPAGEGGWRECIGLARVPADARELVLLLAARGQRSPDDVAWFDDVAVVRME